MKTSLPVCLLIFVSTTVPFISGAQSLRYSISMPYLSLSAYSIKQTDAFSFTGNQASLAQSKAAGIGIYGEQRFLVPGNNVYGLAVSIPSWKGNFGAEINYSGFADFQEQKAGVAYARSLGSKLDLGVQFNYYNYKIPGYYNAAAENFELGAILHLSPKLNAGIHIYNPAGGKLSKGGDEKLASEYKLGLGYDASDEFYFGTEIIKEEDKPVNVTGGVQYRFQKQFFAKAGFRGDNNTVFGGAGFLYHELRIDFAASYHPQLGLSPGISLMYDFKSRQK